MNISRGGKVSCSLLSNHASGKQRDAFESHPIQCALIIQDGRQLTTVNNDYELVQCLYQICQEEITQKTQKWQD